MGCWLDLFMPHIGKVLMIPGLFLLEIGFCFLFLIYKIKQFSNLLLDFNRKTGSIRFYAPIGIMRLLGVILFLVVNIFYKVFK